jgi:hypothetical protein
VNVYVFDTSVWIDLFRGYPPDLFPGLWARIDAAIASGQLVSPHEVLVELDNGNDAIAPILKAKAGLFAPLDTALQAEVTSVLARCPTLVDAGATRDKADPYVVALAVLRSATVVTGEKPAKPNAARMKIPDACAASGVTALDLFAFLRAEGWRL